MKCDHHIISCILLLTFLHTGMKTLANVYLRFTCCFFSQLMVLGNLPVHSIVNLSCACRELRSLSNDSTLWQHLVFRDFGKPQLEN